MRPSLISRACLLAGGIVLAACAGEPRRTTPLAPGAAQRLAAVRIDQAAAIRILHEYRASRGLSAVRLDPALTVMAQRQADAMVTANSLSHDAGGSFQARVHAAGLDAARAAENLGAGYTRRRRPSPAGRPRPVTTPICG